MRSSETKVSRLLPSHAISLMAKSLEQILRLRSKRENAMRQSSLYLPSLKSMAAIQLSCSNSYAVIALYITLKQA